MAELPQPTQWLPDGYSLHQLLGTWEDAPIKDFDRAVAKIRATNTEYDADTLNQWIDAQRVCTLIAKHHGIDGLHEVIKAVAVCSARIGVRMSSRVQSVADFHGIGE